MVTEEVADPYWLELDLEVVHTPRVEDPAAGFALALPKAVMSMSISSQIDHMLGGMKIHNERLHR